MIGTQNAATGSRHPRAAAPRARSACPALWRFSGCRRTRISSDFGRDVGHPGTLEDLVHLCRRAAEKVRCVEGIRHHHTEVLYRRQLPRQCQLCNPAAAMCQKGRARRSRQRLRTRAPCWRRPHPAPCRFGPSGQRRDCILDQLQRNSRDLRTGVHGRAGDVTTWHLN